MIVSAVKPHFVVEGKDDDLADVTARDMLSETFKLHAVTDSESDSNGFSQDSETKEGFRRLVDFINIKSQKNTYSGLSKVDVGSFYKYKIRVDFDSNLKLLGSNYNKVV